MGLDFAVVAMLCLGTLELLVLRGAHDDETGEAQVLIVLGAMVWSDGPSPVLERRLTKAAEYLAGHPDTIVIVSGGQGSNESESEADAMAAWLEAAGIAQGRIYRESASSNTRENLQNSMALMTALGYDPADTPVVVVSSYFHLARVRLLCGRYGLQAAALGAESSGTVSALYSYGREAVALVKSYLMD